MDVGLRKAPSPYSVTRPDQLVMTPKVGFLQRASKLALQALYILRNVCPSVCPSVYLTLILCQNEGTQRDAVFTIG